MKKDWSVLWVAGRCTSTDVLAHGSIRVMPTCAMMGHAAGTAAGLIARAGCSTREVNVRRVQERLVAAGVMTKEVLDQKDSFPVSDEALATAVASVLGKQKPAKGDPVPYRGTALLMAHRERAVPLLRKAYAEATEAADKLVCAQILAVCGDAAGLPTLVSAVEAAEWDKGWNFRGMGQWGPSVSKNDQLIIALGFTRDRRALPVILAKLRQLTPKHELSHHRAVALALSTIGDRAAAKPLAELLSQPGMTGYSMRTLADQKRLSRVTTGDPRSQPLRELMLARALFLLGDHDGVARAVLENYAQDMRGHFARHAVAVLASPVQPSPEK